MIRTLFIPVIFILITMLLGGQSLYAVIKKDVAKIVLSINNNNPISEEEDESKAKEWNEYFSSLCDSFNIPDIYIFFNKESDSNYFFQFNRRLIKPPITLV